MLMTIALILAATIALAALEFWLFWRMGERDERRNIDMRADIAAVDAVASARSTRSREERHHATGSPARLPGRSRSRTVGPTSATGHRGRSAHQ